jgi:hypothetical protein
MTPVPFFSAIDVRKNEITSAIDVRKNEIASPWLDF